MKVDDITLASITTVKIRGEGVLSIALCIAPLFAEYIRVPPLAKLVWFAIKKTLYPPLPTDNDELGKNAAVLAAGNVIAGRLLRVPIVMALPPTFGSALYPFPLLSFHCVTVEPESVNELWSAASNHN